MKAALGLAAAALAAAAPLAAQDDPAPASTNAIVVNAKRSGAPMWTIETPTGIVILVGEMRNVPKSTPWQPERLEEATAEANRVILGVKPKISPGDIFRLIFKGGQFTKLPDKTVASDYLTPEQYARLSALEAEYDADFARKSFLMTAFDFLTKRLRFNKDTVDDAGDVVKKAANRANVPTSRAGAIRGKDMLDSLAMAEPADHIPCLEAAMTAAEIGPELVEKRGADWRAFRIPEVMNNPLEIALSRCWPWADPDVGNELRTIWVEQITAASTADGVTLAVVPLRVLAEDGGVLDQLEAQGLPIGGPVWRK
ncbi:TraB/GumN family protein [Erythrobacter sp. T5W1-R]|uniref:TraB/GumN family protein n=1 Tax=Erythrobacter sp. T5W1-R TaxID=3101752 RepID=UPI002AFF7765|nr:TraB/GumN family protein [Erythrobacter sp. T5W1-R]MEA1618977.1 TraB/GumN family protein [Erythrobacter sp. T5W1-R]